MHITLEYLQRAPEIIAWVSYLIGSVLVVAATKDQLDIGRDLNRLWDARDTIGANEVHARTISLSAQRVAYAMHQASGILLLIFGRLLQS